MSPAQTGGSASGGEKSSANESALTAITAMLDRLQGEGTLEAIDCQFAKFIVRRYQQGFDLALAAAVASHAVSSGQVCAPLQKLPAWMGKLPGFDPLSWREGVRQSALVSLINAAADDPLNTPPTVNTPLVVDQYNRLYLSRLFTEELFLAKQLLARAVPATSTTQTMQGQTLQGDSIASAFSFEPSQDQLLAVLTAASRKLCVISGGPGTGKTSVVSAILHLLHEAFGISYSRMVTTAPTGKAVARLKESMKDQPVAVVTLHRLLRLRRGGGQGGYDQRRPLPYEVVICDEVSMVNQSLMATLMRALKYNSRLVLLGDRHQLASVEAGAVLSSLCLHKGPASAAWCEQVEQTLGIQHQATDNLPQASACLADSVVELTRNYRFSGDAPIGRAASAVREGDVQGLMELLQEGHEELCWQPLADEQPSSGAQVEVQSELELGSDHEQRHDLPHDPESRDAWDQGFARSLGQQLIQRWMPGQPIEQLGEQALLEAQSQFRILCAHRRGIAGVEWVNQIFEQNREQWYHGRPILVTCNEPGLNLYNGDLGVCVDPRVDPGVDPERQSADKTDNASLMVRFADSGVSIAPGQLPEHESAYGMTVHKAQGSEFDSILLIMPPTVSPVLTRELLYTAITRARSRVEIWASAQVLRHAVETPTRRESGLADRLWQNQVG